MECLVVDNTSSPAEKHTIGVTSVEETLKNISGPLSTKRNTGDGKSWGEEKWKHD